jgi:two-component system response regulator NreC
VLTKPPPALRIVLADGHALMRRSLRLLLESEEAIEVVAEASDLTTAVREVQLHHPGVLVIDLSMGNGTSIATIHRLREELPATRIVVLTMQESPVFADEAFAAGAIGVVLAHAADGELAQAVASAARGEEYLSPRLTARLALLRGSSALTGSRSSNERAETFVR